MKNQDIENTIMDVCRVMRKKREITLEEMSKKTGLDPNKISRLENGKTKMTIRDASTLLDALGYKIRIERIIRG